MLIFYQRLKRVLLIISSSDIHQFKQKFEKLLDEFKHLDIESGEVVYTLISMLAPEQHLVANDNTILNEKSARIEYELKIE